jgi:murein L,D-transpeptidase YcbB/YkuD
VRSGPIVGDRADIFSVRKPGTAQGSCRKNHQPECVAGRAIIMKIQFKLILGAAALLMTTPLAAAPKADEPIAVPRDIKQGIDFVYVDPEMSTVARRQQRPRNWLQRIFSGSERNRRSAPNPMFIELARGLEDYQATWGLLPQTKVPAGPVLRKGSSGKRVELLRTRLGLPARGGYDDDVARRVSEYQRVHGLGTPDRLAGRATIGSLNRGAEHYRRRIAINMERAWRLPATATFNRYVLVDSGSAEAILVVRDRIADRMRVVVGSAKTKTPMMAVLMRNAKANPYWNVPPDLISSMTAKRVLQQGVTYLDQFHYEVLSDWSDAGRLVDPKSINWKQVAAGKSPIRVRQLPGPWNSMGEMKFEMPNDYGIYLHDTPHKELFAQDNRWLSNGCVRLEDYRRFASWVFERVPQSDGAAEQSFELDKPVPIYLTYLTVAPDSSGVVFRADPYGFDDLAMPQMMFGATDRVAFSW